MKKLKDLVDTESFIFDNSSEEPKLSPYYFFFKKLNNPVIIYIPKKNKKCPREDALRKIKNYFLKKYSKCNPTIDLNRIYQNLLSNLEKSKLEII